VNLLLVSSMLTWALLLGALFMAVGTPRDGLVAFVASIVLLTIRTLIVRFLPARTIREIQDMLP